MCFVFMLQDIFKGIQIDEDEDIEITQMLDNYKKKGGTLVCKQYIFIDIMK